MVEEPRSESFVAGELPVKLSWKTRLRSGRPTGGPDYGSFYAILPKGHVEELSWTAGQALTARVVGPSIILTPSSSQPEKPRPIPVPKSQYPVDRLICGDVTEELRKIPSDFVHMVITSPPYNVGIAYASYDDKRAYSAYRSWLGGVWRECFRILKRGGRLALEVAPTGIAEFVPLHHDLSRDIRACGFTPRAEILWAKQNFTARRTAWGSWKSPRHPHVIPSWEYVELFHKESWKLEGEADKIDILPEEFVDWSDGVWEIPPESRKFGEHPAAFPEALIKRLLLYFTYKGNLILDPFGGTGTVASAAKKNSRHFLSVDLSEDYTAAAQKRLSKVTFGSDTLLRAARLEELDRGRAARKRAPADRRHPGSPSSASAAPNPSRSEVYS